MSKKIVMVGGGSTGFTPGLLVDFIRTKALYGSTIILVDTDEKKLETVKRLGDELMAAGEADYTLESTTDRASALPGADVVIVSVEINRFPCWESDRRIPAELGIQQALGENGGPGGLFHAMRQIPLVVEIAKDVERLCPEALLLNLSNPMSRILQAVSDLTDVRFIGLCHEIGGGNRFLASLMNSDPDRFHVVAAGLNHFTWYLKILDRTTGADLYPTIKERVQERPDNERLLIADLLQRTGYLCVTTDSHAGEYLQDGHRWESPWARGVEPLAFFEFYKKEIAAADKKMAALIAGEIPPADFLGEASGEVITEIIEATLQEEGKRFDAFNLPNDDHIANLPNGCIVEVPGMIVGDDFGGEVVGPLPSEIASWCETQVAIHRLGSKAAINGDRQAALDALVIDPVVPDRSTAEKCLEQLLEANREYLPRFFS